VIIAAMLSASSFAEGQSLQPGGPLAVRDSQGRILGELVSAYQVSMVVDGKIVILGAFRNGLTDQSTGIGFDQPDCQGNPFMLKRSVGYFLATPAAFGPTGALHVIDNNAPAQTQTLASFYQNFNPPTPGQCLNQTPIVYDDAVPTVQTSFQQSHFTPPLSVVQAASAAAAVPVGGRLGLAVLIAGLAVTGLVVLLR
jgi:hypothetical protein